MDFEEMLLPIDEACCDVDINIWFYSMYIDLCWTVAVVWLFFSFEVVIRGFVLLRLRCGGTPVDVSGQ